MLRFFWDTLYIFGPYSDLEKAARGASGACGEDYFMTLIVFFILKQPLMIF